MTRTLPWLKQPATATKSTSRDRPIKRQKLSDPVSDDDVAPPARRTAIRGISIPSIAYTFQVSNPILRADSFDFASSRTSFRGVGLLPSPVDWYKLIRFADSCAKA